MNYRHFFTIPLLFLDLLAYSQTTCSIHGQVTAIAGMAVPSAVVVLQRATDSSVAGTATADENGRYELKVNAAMIIVRVTAMGYIDEVKTVDAAGPDLTIDFSLQAARSLTGVTVTGRKPMIEEKVDRTVFNVESSIAAIGGDALDALKKTPGVQIMNGEISIAGKNSVSVMINGRLQQLSGQDLVQLLHTIPSGNLSKIEVITSPSARYDAEGNSGIINLVTKKSIKEGLRGSATAGYENHILGSPEVSTALNYKKGRLNLSCNANTGIYGWKYTNRTTTYYPGQRWEQTLGQYSHTRSATLQAGADYTINRRSLIGFQFTESASRMDNTDGTLATTYNSGNAVDSSVYTRGSTRELYRGKHTLNANYEWKIDSSGRKLTVDADYYRQAAEKSRAYTTSDYVQGSLLGPVTDTRLDANPDITIKSIKADVAYPLKAVDLSFGCKVAYAANSADNNYTVYNGADYVNDPSQTNSFAYSEQIQALYANSQRSVGKFDMQVGLRVEHTHNNTFSSTTGQGHTNDYTKLFPSGYVQYKANEGNVFSLSFTRRINRPSYNMLNPFRLYYGPNYYVTGNPDLKPSFSNNIELSYRWKSMYSIKFFAKQTEDYWDRLYSTDSASGMTSLNRANVGTAKYCGVNISMQFRPTAWWESRNTVNGGYAYYSLHYFSSNNIFSGFNEWFETSNSFFFNKSKTWSAEVSAYYYTPRQKDYKRWADMSSIDIGIKAMFLDKNLVVALNLEDLMATAYWRQTNLFNGTNEYSYDNSRGGRLSVTYKFGNKNIKPGHEQKTSEEIQRAN